MVQLKDIGVSFGARALFAKVNLTIGERSRIGLVGANGTGKTTLFRMLSGERSPDEGSLDMPRNLKIGYLTQHAIVLESESVFDSTVAAFSHIHDIRMKMHELEEKMQDPSVNPEMMEKILNKYSHLQEAYARDGYTFEARTEEILQGLGFRKADFERPCREFSGGYQMRIALARLLLSEPDLLLLDEPTNHLDLPSIEWLEAFIRNFKGSLVISSHDRFFLDRVVDTIWDVDYGTITAYKGNYSKFMAQKKERKEQLEKQIKKIAETRAHLQRFIDKYRGYPKKANLVRSRKRMLERLPDVRLPEENNKQMNLRFPDAPKISGRVMALEGVSKSFGEHTVFSDVNLSVQPGDRIALVGANGEGKTTLLRIIAGDLEVTEGQVWTSAKLLKAFYTQIVEAELHPENTVIQELEQVAPGEPIPVLRTIAGMFLFSGDDADKKVAVLSGGEKSRLALAKIILSPSNILLLDEPTNHLDLAARDVLERAVSNYPGTVIFSSHDRFFIDKIASTVMEVKDGKARLHLGNWSDYVHWRDSQKSGEYPNKGKRRKEKVENTGAKKTGNKPKTKKAPAKNQNKAMDSLREAQVNKLFAEIEDVEREIALLEKQMSRPELYEDLPKMREVSTKHRRLKEQLDILNSQLESILA